MSGLFRGMHPAGETLVDLCRQSDMIHPLIPYFLLFFFYIQRAVQGTLIFGVSPRACGRQS